jgi:hypothetical protein
MLRLFEPANVGVGLSVDGYAAIAGLLVARLPNLFAPRPWRMGWRDR